MLWNLHFAVCLDSTSNVNQFKITHQEVPIDFSTTRCKPSLRARSVCGLHGTAFICREVQDASGNDMRKLSTYWMAMVEVSTPGNSKHEILVKHEQRNSHWRHWPSQHWTQVHHDDSMCLKRYRTNLVSPKTGSRAVWVSLKVVQNNGKPHLGFFSFSLTHRGLGTDKTQCFYGILEVFMQRMILMVA